MLKCFLYKLNEFATLTGVNVREKLSWQLTNKICNWTLDVRLFCEALVFRPTLFFIILRMGIFS